VSGVVEETPGRLEYEVALYKEAPPTRVGNNSNSELPVDQAVPIGTKLQLRAKINPDSGMLPLTCKKGSTGLRYKKSCMSENPGLLGCDIVLQG